MSVTETRDKEMEKSKLNQLKELESESQGNWVKCICTHVDPDNLTFRFETVHGRVKGVDFDVPDTLPGSEIQQFLDSVDRAAVNVGLMEGDEFWMHMNSEVIVDEPPSRIDKIRGWPSKLIYELCNNPHERNWKAATFVLFAYPLSAAFGVLTYLTDWEGHRPDQFLAGAASSLLWVAGLLAMLWILL